MQQESMDFDVVIVGAGPAGLAAACYLKQQCQELEVCVLEKASQVGAHILSGAVFETRALDELFPDWSERGAPVTTKVTKDEFYWCNGSSRHIKLPHLLVPQSLHNEGCYLISLGQLCSWLAEQAELLGVQVFTGFTAQSLYIEHNQVKGVITGDLGVAANGDHKDNFMPGMVLKASYTLLGEGCRGHLGKEVMRIFELDQHVASQHYALGFKEIWRVQAEDYPLGRVVHTLGYPLQPHAQGGGFLYFGADHLVTVGLVVDLNYKNPHLSPFNEFQKLKTHPLVAQVLQDAERVSYGARALTKGGLHALPKMAFPGGILLGCDAGTLNSAKIKGTHTAMKSGMLAAETILEARKSNEDKPVLDYAKHFEKSWLYDELYRARNFTAAVHQYGLFLGGAFNYIDQSWFKGRLPLHIIDDEPDHAHLSPSASCTPLVYSKPDGVLTFDRSSSVFFSNIEHEENQPCHLKLGDPNIPIDVNLKEYDEPAQRYCPAAVYEVIEQEGRFALQINAQNCIHCKTCDIKDPCQNITWIPPEGGSGPNYSSM
tara:strand:- start:3941 stop:5569 length:1629 start_codon:yes stop_codon:yes gene_type:complete